MIKTVSVLELLIVDGLTWLRRSLFSLPLAPRLGRGGVGRQDVKHKVVQDFWGLSVGQQLPDGRPVRRGDCQGGGMVGGGHVRQQLLVAQLQIGQMFWMFEPLGTRNLDVSHPVQGPDRVQVIGGGAGGHVLRPLVPLLARLLAEITRDVGGGAICGRGITTIAV